MIRTVFFGTPDFAVPCLEALMQDTAFDVIQVISQPDRPAGRKMQLTPSVVKARALELGLPVITPEKCSSDDFVGFFKDLHADVAVVVAFGQILPQKLLDILPGKFVNLHASLLPRWRGAAPIQRAVMAGDLQTGVSLQVMVKKLDAGAVIAETVTRIEENENSLSLHNRLSLLGARMTQESLPKYLNGEIQPQPQDESLVTYAHKIEKSESLIDWNLSAQQIHQNIRGLAMGPGAVTKLAGKNLKIHKTYVLPENASSFTKPGQVTEIQKDFFAVQTASGQLGILEVQPESKPRMSVGAFLSGYPLEPGLELGESTVFMR